MRRERERERAGVSARKVADAIGISLDDYNAVEAGDVDITADAMTVLRIRDAARAIGTTYQALAGSPE